MFARSALCAWFGRSLRCDDHLEGAGPLRRLHPTRLRLVSLKIHRIERSRASGHRAPDLNVPRRWFWSKNEPLASILACAQRLTFSVVCIMAPRAHTQAVVHIPNE